MKYTTVLVSLLAVATAAKLPNASPDVSDVVARHDGHNEKNTTTPGDGYDQDLEKRRGGGAGAAGAGGAGGSHSSGAGGSRGGSSGSQSSSGCPGPTCDRRPHSGASALMSLDVGLLVAGLTGAGVGAVFL